MSTVNQEITNVNIEIQGLTKDIQDLRDANEVLIGSRVQWDQALAAGLQEINRINNVAIPACKGLALKHKREACTLDNVNQRTIQENKNAQYQAKIDSINQQIESNNLEIAAVEDAIGTLHSQISILKTKQAAENNERQTLADQGTSWTAQQEIAQAEGKAKQVSAEIEANANAEVIRAKAAATLDEEEEAARLKNQRTQIITYSILGVVIIVVIILAVKMIKKFKKKK